MTERGQDGNPLPDSGDLLSVDDAQFNRILEELTRDYNLSPEVLQGNINPSSGVLQDIITPSSDVPQGTVNPSSDIFQGTVNPSSDILPLAINPSSDVLQGTINPSSAVRQQTLLKSEFCLSSDVFQGEVATTDQQSYAQAFIERSSDVGGQISLLHPDVGGMIPPSSRDPTIPAIMTCDDQGQPLPSGSAGLMGSDKSRQIVFSDETPTQDDYMRTSTLFSRTTLDIDNSGQLISQTTEETNFAVQLPSRQVKFEGVTTPTTQIETGQLNLDAGFKNESPSHDVSVDSQELWTMSNIHGASVSPINIPVLSPGEGFPGSPYSSTQQIFPVQNIHASQSSIHTTISQQDLLRITDQDIPILPADRNLFSPTSSQSPPTSLAQSFTSPTLAQLTASSRIELALRIPEPGKNWNINETF